MGISDDIYTYVKQIPTAISRLDKAQKDIDALTIRMDRISNIVDSLIHELQRTRENNQHDQEKLILSLENRLKDMEIKLLRQGISNPPVVDTKQINPKE